MNLARFPRRRYTTGRTPIDFLERLTEHLGGPKVYLKRDDLLGLTAGGNKTRKLEFLIADALSNNADTIITTGAVQSNHCRLTLSAAVREGLACHLLIEERVPGSYDPRASGNNLLFKLLGAEQIEVVDGGANLSLRMSAMADEVRAQGRIPYIIPGGGSNALGALGYISCAEEILSQTFDRSLPVDHVVCASGSGGTHAGLLAGFVSNQSGIRVTGISVGADKETQEAKVQRLANEAAVLAGAQIPITDELVQVEDSFVGPGYSMPTDEMAEAVSLFARLEGVLLDPVYTGKMAAGFIGLTREGRFKDHQDVLLIHTGGSPALYAYEEAIVK